MLYVLVPLSVGEPASNSYQFHGIRRSYLSKLTKNNLTPLLVSTLNKDSEIDELYKMSSSVLLMGGTDIKPINYGEKKQKETKLIDHALDSLELKILSKVFEDKKPVLGICRGCQMINVLRGGTLNQHLSDKYNCNHEVANYTHLGEIKTKINIEKNSKLYKITGQNKALVNCGHHQCVEIVGQGLKVSSTDKHGVPESVETIDPSHFCMGIQAHIETQSSVFANSIFKELSIEASKFNTKK